MKDITSKIGSGSTPKGSNYSDTGFPFFRSQNVHNDGLVFDDIKYITKEIHHSMKGTVVQAKDLLLNITGGSIGRCAVVPNDFKEGNVSQHVCIIRPIIIDSEYLHTYILSDLFWESMKLTGSGREGLPKYNLEQMLLPLPPLEEQGRICQKLKECKRCISFIEEHSSYLVEVLSETKTKILELAMQGKLVPQDPADEPVADMLRRINPKAHIITTDTQHYPQLPYNWVYVSIDDINSYIPRNITPSQTPDKIFDLYSVPVFPTGDSECISGKEIGSTKQAVSKNDILLCKINPHLNRVWTVGDKSQYTQIASSEWIVIRSKELYAPYLKHYFSSPRFRKLLCSQVSGVGGSLTRAQPAIVKQYLVPIPPIEEQKRIVSKLEKMIDCLDQIQTLLDCF